MALYLIEQGAEIPPNFFNLLNAHGMNLNMIHLDKNFDFHTYIQKSLFTNYSLEQIRSFLAENAGIISKDKNIPIKRFITEEECIISKDDFKTGDRLYECSGTVKHYYLESSINYMKQYKSSQGES